MDDSWDLGDVEDDWDRDTWRPLRSAQAAAAAEQNPGGGWWMAWGDMVRTADPEEAPPQQQPERAA